MKPSRQSGFTLIEIAIVLVIIGLILAGVLQGQTLINNAKYKSFSKEIDSYRVAAETFKDMYKALPGDINVVSALDASAPQGDGDGLVEGGFCDSAGEESCAVWQHLRYAKLIPGDPGVSGPSARPSHGFGGVVSSIATGNWANGVMQVKLLTQGVPGDVAQRYDNEFDDGNATSGSVARYGGSGSTYAPNSSISLFIAL